MCCRAIRTRDGSYDRLVAAAARPACPGLSSFSHYSALIVMDNSDPPLSGRLCGIDFGTVRIGLASCDPSQQWVTPLKTYVRRSEKLDREFFCQLAKQEELAGWVVGLPLHCDGKESKKSKEVRDFANWLTLHTGLPASLYDERFTTREARQLMQNVALSGSKKKKKLDSLAAHLILTHFLDWQRNQTAGNSAISPNQPIDDGE